METSDAAGAPAGSSGAEGTDGSAAAAAPPSPSAAPPAAPVPPAILQARAAMLAKSLGITIGPDDLPRTETRDAALALAIERTGAIPADGASLHAAALGALREALFEVRRVPRESVRMESPFDPFLGFLKFRTWKRLQKETGCKLPPPVHRWPSVLMLALTSLWLFVALPAFADDPDRDVRVGGMLGVLVTALIPYVVGLSFARAPGEKGDVAAFVRWIVATSPAPLRGGTGWTVSQVTEVVDALWGLRWRTRSARLFLSAEFVGWMATLLALAAFLWAIFRCVGDLIFL
jgi:hypothetical protein